MSLLFITISRCSAHTLNLIASTDYKKIIAESSLNKLHDRTFLKCSQIWNGTHRPSQSEAIKRVINRQLTYPNVTRWNSLQDCSLQLLDVFNGSVAEGTEFANNLLHKLLEATVTKTYTFTTFSRAEIDYILDLVHDSDGSDSKRPRLSPGLHQFFLWPASANVDDNCAENFEND